MALSNPADSLNSPKPQERRCKCKYLYSKTENRNIYNDHGGHRTHLCSIELISTGLVLQVLGKFVARLRNNDNLLR